MILSFSPFTTLQTTPIIPILHRRGIVRAPRFPMLMLLLDIEASRRGLTPDELDTAKFEYDGKLLTLAEIANDFIYEEQKREEEQERKIQNILGSVKASMRKLRLALEYYERDKKVIIEPECEHYGRHPQLLAYDKQKDDAKALQSAIDCHAQTLLRINTEELQKWIDDVPFE